MAATQQLIVEPCSIDSDTTLNRTVRRSVLTTGCWLASADEQRRHDQGDRAEQLDDDVQRRTGGVFERIADSVADD